MGTVTCWRPGLPVMLNEALKEPPPKIDVLGMPLPPMPILKPWYVGVELI